jgi:hypothetical protein
VRYTAAALTAAARPVVLTIGRAGTRWWSRRWVQHARTWQAHPLSVPQMLALQAAQRDPVQYLLTLLPILRAVLPRRWWYRLVGDPVRMILRLPEPLIRKVLQALVTVPNTDRDVSQETDDVELIRRAQRAAVHGDTPDGGVSLAVAALSVRAAYGDVWYYNPQRWPTSDGYVPFAVALIEFAGIQALDVRRRLEVADGYALAHAKPHEKERMHRLAYPQEVC